MSSGFSTVNKDGKSIWEPGLPASVTARRVTATSADGNLAAVSCDLRLTLKMSASHKAEWLEKALRAILAGKTKVQDVFNIVTHPKFASGVSEKHGKRMFQALSENMEHFSDKQRLTLSSCKLASLVSNEAAVKRSRSRDPSPKARARARSRSSSQRSPKAQPEHHSPEEDIDKKQEEEKRRIEMQKRKLKEQEEKRKAKLGAAFQFEPEAEAESNKKQLQSKLEKSHRKEELPSLSRLAAPFGREADPRFVEAMGGDKLLQEAHKILRHAAGSGRIENHSRSRSRRRSRKSRSPRSPRSAKHQGGSKPHVRSSGSYRSPTPDGRARGQARAARKAKMIASLMGKR